MYINTCSHFLFVLSLKFSPQLDLIIYDISACMEELKALFISAEHNIAHLTICSVGSFPCISFTCPLVQLKVGLPGLRHVPVARSSELRGPPVMICCLSLDQL